MTAEDYGETSSLARKEIEIGIYMRQMKSHNEKMSKYIH